MDFSLFGYNMSATPWTYGPPSGIPEFSTPKLFLPKHTKRHSLTPSMSNL